MPSIPALLRSLGNDGALRNVRIALEARAREDWLLAGLADRLEGREPTEEVAVPPTATTSVADAA